MGNFLLTRNDERGAALESAWVAAAAGAHDLTTERRIVAGWAIRWSVGRTAPLSTWEGDGVGAVLIGAAVDGTAGHVDAEGLAHRIRSSEDPGSWGLDGYFVAIVCDRERAVVMSDVLGLFPVYRGTGAAPFVSSIPLGAGVGRLDPFGVAGLLAFHGPVGGRLIIPDVRRVSVGHAVIAGAADVVERSVFSWPDEETHAAEPLDEQDAMLHEAFTRALDCQLPPSGEVGLLLTGGRDSRTLAGRLARIERPFVARTVGQPRDHDAMLAALVADRLGVDHTIAPLPHDAFVRGMDHHLMVDHLGTGASQCWWRGAVSTFDGLPDRSVTGHVYDVIVGGMMRPTGVRDFGTDVPWDFARPMERRFGVSDEVLAGLRYPEAREGVEWAMQTMREAYLAHPTAQRVWRWVLNHFVRFQVGMVLQPISLRTWPIVPVLSRELIDVAARLDSRRFAARQGQDRMLRRYYPEMAAIAHTVENADPGTALSPSVLRKVRDRLFSRPRRPGPVAWKGDRRFVWRNTDFFNPGWTALRERAEPLRERLHELVEAAPLDAYLPGPRGALQQIDFAAQQGPKLLVALALWLERYG